MKKLLIAAAVALLGGTAAVAFFAREPNVSVEWTREVPSKETAATLAPAFRDTRNWPIFHHSLREVRLTEGGKPVPEFDRVSPGMIATFAIEPKGKEWKRFLIVAEVLPPKVGEALRFRLLSESTGKSTRLLDGFEWWVGFRPANAEEASRGYATAVFGGASAETKTPRARFFGRVAPTILMNQLYQIDLVRLASFTANMEAWAGDHAPVYR
ncbi:MAG: hypothetical protein JST04_03930 [Bdellovibrionales bacterium]|nr:hypothetical protein [Bdellovibrionales bacterium]